MRIVKLFLVIAIAALGTFHVYPQLLNTTIATVRLTETEVISRNEIESQFEIVETQLNTRLTSDQKNELLQSNINTILITQAAERARLEPTENEILNAIEAQKASLNVPVTDIQYRQIILEQTGLSWEEYREQVVERILQEKYILYARPNFASSIEQPTEREIQMVYEQNASSFVSPLMSGFSHIWIDTRELSGSELNTARSKMDVFNRRIRNRGQEEFDRILRETLDDASVMGGDFGYVMSGEPNVLGVLGQEFVDTILEMSDGDVSMVLESQVGLHIAKVTDKRSPRLLGLDDPILPGQSLTVRQNVIRFILNQRQQEALLATLEEITAELRAEADIRIVQNNISW